jgi:hypothetical protein
MNADKAEDGLRTASWFSVRKSILRLLLYPRSSA